MEQMKRKIHDNNVESRKQRCLAPPSPSRSNATTAVDTIASVPAAAFPRPQNSHGISLRSESPLPLPPFLEISGLPPALMASPTGTTTAITFVNENHPAVEPAKLQSIAEGQFDDASDEEPFCFDTEDTRKPTNPLGARSQNVPHGREKSDKSSLVVVDGTENILTSLLNKDEVKGNRNVDTISIDNNNDNNAAMAVFLPTDDEDLAKLIIDNADPKPVNGTWTEETAIQAFSNLIFGPYRKKDVVVQFWIDAVEGFAPRHLVRLARAMIRWDGTLGLARQDWKDNPDINAFPVNNSALQKSIEQHMNRLQHVTEEHLRKLKIKKRKKVRSTYFRLLFMSILPRRPFHDAFEQRIDKVLECLDSIRWRGSLFYRRPISLQDIYNNVRRQARLPGHMAPSLSSEKAVPSFPHATSAACTLNDGTQAQDAVVFLRLPVHQGLSESILMNVNPKPRNGGWTKAAAIQAFYNCICRGRRHPKTVVKFWLDAVGSFVRPQYTRLAKSIMKRDSVHKYALRAWYGNPKIETFPANPDLQVRVQQHIDRVQQLCQKPFKFESLSLEQRGQLREAYFRLNFLGTLPRRPFAVELENRIDEVLGPLHGLPWYGKLFKSKIQTSQVMKEAYLYATNAKPLPTSYKNPIDLTVEQAMRPEVAVAHKTNSTAETERGPVDSSRAVPADNEKPVVFGRGLAATRPAWMNESDHSRLVGDAGLL